VQHKQQARESQPPSDKTPPIQSPAHNTKPTPASHTLWWDNHVGVAKGPRAERATRREGRKRKEKKKSAPSSRSSSPAEIWGCPAAATTLILPLERSEGRVAQIARLRTQRARSSPLPTASTRPRKSQGCPVPVRSHGWRGGLAHHTSSTACGAATAGPLAAIARSWRRCCCCCCTRRARSLSPPHAASASRPARSQAPQAQRATPSQAHTAAHNGHNLHAHALACWFLQARGSFVCRNQSLKVNVMKSFQGPEVMLKGLILILACLITCIQDKTLSCAMQRLPLAPLHSSEPLSPPPLATPDVVVEPANGSFGQPS
jgi:hypothetical protein